MTEKEVHVIKFGDSVLLHDFIDKGYLTARRQKACQLMVETNDFSRSLDGVPPHEENPNPRPPEPADCVFRVVPKLAYSKYNAFMKTVRGIKDPESPDVTLTPVQLAALAKWQQEKLENIKLCLKMRASPVIYGATIQLFHERTGAYITMQKERADCDASKLKVSLDEAGNKNSWFNFNPGYKTGKMGETVSYPSVCILTSPKNDVNIHVSTKGEADTQIRAEHLFVEDVLEVNAFVQGTVFRVFPYRLNRDPSLMQLEVSSGEPFTLYHADNDANLVYEDGRVFFRQKNSETDRSLDSSALWTCENSSAMMSGAFLNSTQPYRLQHAISGECFFGGVESGDQLSTSQDFLQKPAEWGIKPFGASRKQIYVGGQIQLVSSNGNFVCADAKEFDTGKFDLSSNQVSSDRDALVISRPDPSLMQVLTKTKEYKRRVQEVIDRMIQTFEKCNSYAKAVQNEVPTLLVLYSQMTLNCTLGSGNDPFTKVGEPSVPWQDIFGEQELMEMTIRVIRTIFDETETVEKTIGETTTTETIVGLAVPMADVEGGKVGKQAEKCIMLMFRYLRMLVAKNSVNQSKLGEHIPFLNSYLNTKFQVVDTVSELFTGNMKVLTTLDDAALDGLIAILREKHEKSSSAARFVDLLRNICGCNGVPISENQNRVVEKFVMVEDLQLSLEYRSVTAGISESGGRKKKKKAAAPAVEGAIPHICDVAHEGEWIPLTEFCGKTTAILAKPINACSLNEKIYRYHIQSMRLFVALCAGRNRLATDYLLSKADQFGLAYHDLMNVLKNDIIPPVYRGIIAEVIVALYIDREPNEQISPINRIHIWSEVKPQSEPQRQLVDPFKNFPALRPTPGFSDFKDYLLVFLSGQSSFDPKDPNKSSLQGRMILMAKLLLEFGFYHDGDLADLGQCSTLLDPLLDLLDGRSDGDYPQRCQESQETAPIFVSKLDICKILEFIFDCRQDKRLRMGFKCYEDSMNRALKAGTYKGGKNEKGPWEAEMADLQDNLFNKPLISKKVAMSADIRKPPIFVLILLDCMRYEYPSLVVTALSLLNRHFSQRAAMIKTMQTLQVVVFSEVAELVGEVRVHVSEMRRNRKWLKSPSVKDRENAMEAVHRILDRWLDLMQLHNIIDINGKSVAVGAGEVTKFQSMLKNLGAVEKVMDVLKMPAAGSTAEMYEIYLKLYDFLCLFCQGNEANQLVIYEQRKHFFAHMKDDILALPAGKVMTTAVENNKQLMESISEGMLTDVFAFLNQNRVHTWLDFCTYLCKFNGQRHTRNSAQVMKRISANPDLLELFTGNEGLANLSTSISIGDFETVDWHLSSMKLLSTCCMDKSPDNEVKAQTSVSWRDVLSKCLNLENMPAMGEDAVCDAADWGASILECKQVYLDFIKNVYVMSETEVAKLVFAEEGSARVWPSEDLIGNQPDQRSAAVTKSGNDKPHPVTWIANNNILLQRWYQTVMFKTAGANVTWNRAKNPRTLAHEWVSALQKFVKISRQLDGPGGKKKKKKKKKKKDGGVLDMLDDVVPVDMTEARVFSKYVSGTIIPILQAYYNSHYQAEGANHIQQRTSSTIMNLVCAGINSSLLETSEMTKFEALVITMESHGFNFEGEMMDEPNNAGPKDNDLFKNGFQTFLADFAKTLGIADLKRVLGVGIKNLARMLTLDDVPDTNPVQTYREVIFRIFEVLISRPPELKDPLLVDMLRMTRAIVYMDDPRDPEGLNQDEAWNDYVADRPPKKSEPQRQMVEWVQTKVNELGGIVAAGQAINHPVGPVSIAALRFGITLMEQGNKTAQTCLLKNLIESQNDSFFWKFSDYFSKACIAIKEWRVHLKKKVLAAELTSRRSAKGGSGGGAVQSANIEPDAVELATTACLKDVSLALRFLQLSMEGHYLGFQNLLREQESNRVSYNILNSSTELLSVLEASLQFCFENKNSTIFPLFVQLLEFMTESMQGSCFPNQCDLSSNQSAMVYDRILKTTSFASNAEFDDQILKTGTSGEPITIRSAKCILRSSLVTTIVSILEDNYDLKLGQRMLSNIDASALGALIVSVYDGFYIEDELESDSVLQVMENSDMSEADVDEDGVKEHALQTYCLLKYLQDRESPELGPVYFTMKGLKAKKDIYAECTKWTTSIEVARNHWTASPDSDPVAMMRVHFKIPDFCLQIQTRDVFKKHCEKTMLAIPRSNPVEKVLKMLGQLNTLTHEMDHMYGLVSNTTMYSEYIDTKLIVERCDWIQNKPLLFALITMASLTLFYGEHDDPYGETKYVMQVFTNLMAAIQFGFACIWACTFYLIQAPIVCKIASGGAKSAPVKPQKVQIQDNCPVYELPLKPVPPPPKVKSYNELKAEHMAYSKASAYYLVFVFISFLAMMPVANMQFFMFFWVLDYFRLPYGFVVMQAVNAAGFTLMKIGTGAMLLAIMWTSWSFWLFQKDANAYAGQCKTAYQCVLFGIHHGLRGDLAKSWGPIPTAEHNFPETFYDENSLAFQWLLVLAYKIMWRFVFIGILTATIVGAFGGIRGKEADDAKDAQDRCIVCSISRFTLEQEGGGFSEHTSNHHNPWSFLAFLAGLKIGDEDEFTGLESYVAGKAKLGDYTFIPIGFCTEIQANQRRKEIEKQNANALAENDADGADAMQKKLLKGLDDIVRNTSDLQVDLPADLNDRLESLEASMSKMVEIVERFTVDA